MKGIVRNSKYRHVFGTPLKKEQCYEDLRVHSGSADSNPIKASGSSFAVTWKTSGGGAVAVVPYAQQGRVKSDHPLIVGHTGAVLDMDFNPFNDDLLATVSEDCMVKLWGIPPSGLTEPMSAPLVEMQGHSRKVNVCTFNPVAANILATASFDQTLKVWDAATGQEALSVDVGDQLQSISWNYNGSIMACVGKDKKLRVVDLRAQTVAQEGPGHEGSKPSRVVFLGNKDRMLTTGFSRVSERQYGVWDPRNLAEPLGMDVIDVASGYLIPFYDCDTGILFLAGKGDGNMRFFEVVDEPPYLFFLSEHKTNDPQRGLAMCPKSVVDVMSCEIVRMLKLTEKMCEPIQFRVPRKSDMFQDDIFPDTAGAVPALDAAAWLAGETKDPILVSMKPGATSKQEKAKVNVVARKTVIQLEKELEVAQKRIAQLEEQVMSLGGTP